MVNNSVAEIGGKKVARALEVISWDYEKSKISHSYFGTWGTGQGVWTTAGDRAELEWTIQGRYGTFKGTSYVAKGDDSWQWQIRKQTHNGEELPDTPLATFHRTMGAPAGDLWQACRDAFVGSWLGSGTLAHDSADGAIAKGDKFEYCLTWTPDLNGMALVGDGDFQVLNKDYREQVKLLLGWDPYARCVRLHGYWTSGLLEEIQISRQEGKDLLGTYAGKFVGIPADREAIRYHFTGPDSCVIKILDGPRKGENLATWKRQSPADQATAADYIEYHKPLLGAWKAIAEEDGKTCAGTINWQLGAGDKCVVVDVKLEGRPALQAVMGYNPVNGKWDQMVFDADGMLQLAGLEMADMKKGKGLSEGFIGNWEEERFRPDGTTITGSSAFSCTEMSKDRITFVWSNRKEGGKSLPDFRLTYQRP